jgi:hypothetical protein
MRTLRIALYCLLGGLPLTIAAAGAGHFGWWWLSGIVLAGAFVPVALFGPRNLLAQFGAIFLTLFVVGSLCIEWEAAIFLPGEKGQLGRDLMSTFQLYLVTAVVLALLAKVLRLTDSSALKPEVRPAAIVAIMIGVSGLSYVLYYLIFGSITYQYFTKQYYPQGQAMVVSFGVVRFWLVELARGVLMTLAVLPVICTLRMPRWAAAVSVGILMWIAGGGAQLLVPSTLMVPAQRYIHIVEILTENAAFGITAVLLLRRPRSVRIVAEVAATS